jgi:hypothetical protein
MRSLLSAILLLLILIPPGFAQKTDIPRKKFSLNDLREDFIVWKRTLQKDHPILYHYRSRSEFKAFFDSLYVGITEPMTDLEFLSHIGSSVSFIRCAHVYLGPGSDLRKNVLNDSFLLPIDVKWFQDTAFVTANYSFEEQPRVGCELIAINGADISKIRTHLLKYLPQDGLSKGVPRSSLNKIFFYLYNIHFGCSEQYEITYRNEEKQQKIRINGLSLSHRTKEMRKSKTGHLSKFRGTLYAQIRPSVGYLRVGSFESAEARSSDGRDFREYIDSVFQQIREQNLKKLIIDIQGNGGGSPRLSLYLTRYLMLKKFEYKSEFRKVRRWKEESFSRRSKNALIGDFSRGNFKPVKNAFKGKVILLVDNGTNSAASWFSGCFKRYERGIIIGTETGGNPVILTGYWFKFGMRKLPNTKLEYTVPRRTSIMGDPETNNGRGLIPDVLLEVSSKDYFEGLDPSLTLALKLIEEGK